MVSVFEGQLMRTWSYSLSDDTSSVLSSNEEKKRPKKHVINLYHDTITGDKRYSHSSLDNLIVNNTFASQIALKICCNDLIR
jgi:hypothetical protein